MVFSDSDKAILARHGFNPGTCYAIKTDNNNWIEVNKTSWSGYGLKIGLRGKIIYRKNLENLLTRVK